MHRTCVTWILAALLCIGLVGCGSASPTPPAPTPTPDPTPDPAASPSPAMPAVPQAFAIRVVDADTGRGVPLVELKTSNNILYYTDSNGYIAFQEPGLMDQDVFFQVTSHGYSYPKDMFNLPSVTIRVYPGGEKVLRIHRDNIAERLYRLTGQGIYRDSVLLGKPVPIRDPLLNARVAGQDSTHAIVYRDKLFWIWGDTTPVFHLLGNFRVTAATSALPGQGGLPPETGVDYTYFTRPDGFAKQMVPVLPGDPNLVWIGSLMTAEDDSGAERLFCSYTTLHGLGKDVEAGVMAYNDEAMEFDERYPFDMSEDWKLPRGSATRYEDGGTAYWIFSHPWSVVRVEDDIDAITDQGRYEYFTCLEPGARYEGRNSRVERNGEGQVVWGWKKDTQVLAQDQELILVRNGLLSEEEARFQLRDADSGKPVKYHAGSIRWNDYRGKWILIGNQAGGDSSFLGEVWFAEADDPTGPWGPAKKILTHTKYSLYNPIHHPFFDQEGGRIIYFEGTYSTMFEGSPATPWYDYNQVLYRLDLGDDRLMFGDPPPG